MEKSKRVRQVSAISNESVGDKTGKIEETVQVEENQKINKLSIEISEKTVEVPKEKEKPVEIRLPDMNVIEQCIGTGCKVHW